MGFFGKSKKKKKQQAERAQAALLKAKQEREAAEAEERKRAAQALQQRQAEAEEEKKEEDDSPDFVSAEKDQSLNETIDTADEEPQDHSLEQQSSPQPKEIAISSNDETGAFPSASDEPRGPLEEEGAEEPMDLPPVQEEEEAAPQAPPAEDAAWTPFATDPFASATYDNWQFEESEPEDAAAAKEEEPLEDSLLADNGEEEAATDLDPQIELTDESMVVEEEEAAAVAAVPSADEIMNDLEKAEGTEEKKEGTEDQPPIAGAEEGTDKVTEAEEKKEEEAPKEPPFDSEKAFNKAREMVDEAAVTIGLAVSAAAAMASACVGDIQAGFSEEINDNASLATMTVNDDNTLDGTIDSRGNYTDDDASRGTYGTYDDASRYSKSTYGDDRSRYSRGDDTASRFSTNTADDSVSRADNETPANRYRRYDDTKARDDVSRDGSRTSRVKFQEPANKPLPTVKSQDVNDVDSSMGTVLAANVSPATSASALGPQPEDESLDEVLNAPQEPATIDEEEDDADGEYFSLEDLQQRKVEGIDETQREKYLSPKEFRSSFNMSKSEFDAMPKWKRDSAKKRVSLF